VLLQPSPDSHRAAVVVRYHAGSLSDPEGLTGITHLAEHMAFRGSRHLSGEQLWTLPQAWEARAIGAFTSADATVFHLVVPPEQRIPSAIRVSLEPCAAA